MTYDILNVTCRIAVLRFVNLIKKEGKYCYYFTHMLNKFIVSLKMACTQDLRV